MPGAGGLVQTHGRKDSAEPLVRAAVQLSISATGCSRAFREAAIRFFFASAGISCHHKISD